MVSRRQLAMLICTLALSVLITACAKPTEPPSEPDAETKIYLSWPKPPAPARIELVQVITSARDVGIEPGLWDHMLSWLVGTKKVSMVRPTAAVMTSEEVLYVADPGLTAVHRFDIKHKRHDVIQRDGDLPFVSPIALALGPDQAVFVTDSGLRQVFVISEGAESARLFPLDHQLDRPTGIAVDRQRRRLHLVDTSRHEVLTFDLAGRLLLRFGQRGLEDGRFNFPTFIWHDAITDTLWVTDSLNFRVQRFDPKGQFLATFGQLGDATGSFSRPKGVATDSGGHVYIIDALFHSMQVFNPTGELLIHIGEQGTEMGQFWLPTALFVDDQDRIFVADSFNKRVQVFRYLADKR